MDSAQTEQARLDLDIKQVKDVILTQQKTIEKHEKDKRQKNLIFSGVPECNVCVGDTQLNDDISKVNYICESISSDHREWDIESCARLGVKRSGRNRILQVKFTSLQPRNDTLYQQRVIRSDPQFYGAFGRVYINADSSFLMRMEEKRLRDRLKDEKGKISSDSRMFIRSGKLYLNDQVIDQINIENQLF